MVAARSHILKLQCTKFDFVCGSAQTPLGKLTSLPRFPSWIFGVPVLLWEGDGKRAKGKRMTRSKGDNKRGKVGDESGREVEEKEARLLPNSHFWLRHCSK